MNTTQKKEEASSALTAEKTVAVDMEGDKPRSEKPPTPTSSATKPMSVEALAVAVPPPKAQAPIAGSKSTTVPAMTATAAATATPSVAPAVVNKAAAVSQTALSPPHLTPPATGVMAIPTKVPGVTITHKALPLVKKRKLHKAVPVTQLLADHPVIQKTVHNLLGLLQTYGPLTVGQLEYNLPPIVGERVRSATLHDILQVLVCMGLVQRVADPASDTPKPDPPPRYSVHQGIPRADVVLPHTLLDQVRATQEEIAKSAARRKRLRAALQGPAATTSQRSSSPPKDLLKELALDYPEIVQDPVYLTALRACHVDVSQLERERRVRQAARRVAQATAASHAKAVAKPVATPVPPMVKLATPAGPTNATTTKKVD